jgi:hypothetical protein
VIQVASNPGDLLLDSFLGSGTTAAVAQKMGRRWVGIEMGEHARTHCLPRLEKVIAGEQGGVSEAVDWEGGGGFRFYTLGEPVFDADGGINPRSGSEHWQAIFGISKPARPRPAASTRRCWACMTARRCSCSTTASWATASRLVATC